MSTIDQLGKESNQKKGIPCIESRQLADALSDSDRTEHSYDSLSAVIGADVRGKARGYLLTAREIVLREKGFVFRPIRNIGLKRLNHTEVAALDDRFTHVRKTHKKTLREMGTVDIATVSESARISCAAKMALAHMTVHTHQPKQIKRLESTVGQQQSIDLAATLAAFKVIE